MGLCHRDPQPVYGHAVRPEGTDEGRSVEFPYDAESSVLCQAMYAQVFIRSDASVDPRAYVAERLERRESGLYVLGVSNEALWVVEARIRVDACDTGECIRVVLREVRFDGSRIEHEIGEPPSGEPAGADDVIPVVRAARTLRKMEHLSKDRVRPIRTQFNAKPSPQTSTLSDWIVQVPVASERKTYMWRLRSGSYMCWCTSDYEVSTHVWASPPK